MKDIILFILLGLILLRFGYVVILGFINGVFHSSYGESMTVRRNEGPIGFYFIGAVYNDIIFFILYI
jgi:hypothetical protein